MLKPAFFTVAGLLRMLVCGWLLLCFMGAAAQSGKDVALQLADPAMLFYKGTYYLYGTVEENANEGFIVYTSRNKKTWQRSKYNGDGYALRKGDAFGTGGFWAPQVFLYRDTFYMAYVANEQIAIAKSTHPEGPFTQVVKAPLEAPVKQIDPFVFMDDDGKVYLYHVRLEGGNKLFVAQMQNDLSAIMPQSLRLCIEATAPWENTAAAAWPVAEGPTIQKRDGIYYLFYTANDFRNPDYAVGYAWSNSPFGPWQKNERNPILHRSMVLQNGPGHGDFVAGRKGQKWYVLHTHHTAQKVAPRKTAIVKIKFYKTGGSSAGQYRIKRRSFAYLRMKS